MPRKPLSVIDLTTQNVPPEAPDASAKVSDSVSANPLKRKIDDPAGPQSGSDSDSSDDDNLVIMPDKSPDQVRKAIRAFIENGDMKIYEFCNAIGVSNNSYNNFLKQTGNSKGMCSETYPRAWRFFWKREQKGKPWPRKRAKKAAGGANVPTTDISEVHLPVEENNQVKIFDTCAEIRKKIGAHLRKPNVTQAQFCRDLKAQFHGDDTPKVTSTSLDHFRGKKGVTQGNMSCVYYAAYCFFEKTRIMEGKPKSKVREEMEKEWPEGVITDRPLDRINAPEDAHVYQDKYGHIHCDNRSISTDRLGTNLVLGLAKWLVNAEWRMKHWRSAARSNCKSIRTPAFPKPCEKPTAPLGLQPTLPARGTTGRGNEAEVPYAPAASVLLPRSRSVAGPRQPLALLWHAGR